ncbi:MAG: hypothetical protein Q7J79_04595, partial [Gemmatimonadales bacterium]|nr:hypothetical protein [Gemmatimonadales bacterium]
RDEQEPVARFGDQPLDLEEVGEEAGDVHGQKLHPLHVRFRDGQSHSRSAARVHLPTHGR